MKICPKCDTTHSKSGIYCSRKCANSRKFSAETRLKTSYTLKEKYASGELVSKIKPAPMRISEYPYTRLYGLYTCHHCNNIFWKLQHQQKCCSVECRDSIRSQNKCRKTHIKYFSKFDNKEIDLQSTWELKIVIWMDANNIVWSRPSKRIKWFCNQTYKFKTYLPDFFLVNYNHFIDVKNPVKTEEDKNKLSSIKNIIPLFVGDINMCIDFMERLAGIEPACIH